MNIEASVYQAETAQLQARAAGPIVRLYSLGGTIQSLALPDRNGALTDVTPGFDRIEDYLQPGPYFGALIGRFANRIARGRFTLDGREFILAANDGPNHLHGGLRGFDKVVWQMERVEEGAGPGIRLRYVSQAGEEGYPGTLAVEVTCTLTRDDVLRFDYVASTDEPTHINLTNHTYFNLAGHAAGDITQHDLAINASHFLPVDDQLIPSGHLCNVAGTPFDFRSPKKIGALLHTSHEQLRLVGGYDHSFVLDRKTGDELTLAARLHEPVSGRTLEVWTTEPAVHFYSGNSLGGIIGKGGHRYTPHCALALETQHFPDSPNQSAFPSTVLRPGAIFRSCTEYRFSVE